MIYLLVRFIIIIILVIVVILLIKKKKIKIHKKRYYVLFAVGICVMTVIIFNWRIEGNFIKFDSLEDSFNYSVMGGEQNTVIEDDNCVFIVSQIDESTFEYHTASKFDDKWGMVDFNSQGQGYIISNKNNNSKINSCGIIVINNKDYNKSAYILTYTKIFENDEKIENIIDVESKEKYKILTEEHGESWIKTQYYIVKDGGIPKEFTVNIDGEEIKFVDQIGYLQGK